MRASPLDVRNQRGIALIMVLWAVTGLSILVGGFIANTRTQTDLARNIVETTHAESLADAAVHRIILEMVELGASQGVQLDAFSYQWSYNGGNVMIVVQDERGKIDINAASDDMLRILFLAGGLTNEAAIALVDRVADFRDEDREPLANGAEDDEYFAAGMAYGAKDAPFETVEELESVLGISRPLFARISPALTIYSGDTEPVWELSPPSLLSLLAPVIEDVGYGDTNTIGGLRQAIADRASALSEPIEPDLEQGLQSNPDVPFGSVFTIHAEARTGEGSYFVRDAVIEIIASPDQPYDILEWRQGRRSLL